MHSLNESESQIKRIALFEKVENFTDSQYINGKGFREKGICGLLQVLRKELPDFVLNNEKFNFSIT